MDLNNVSTVAIIGAGVAGLATAKTLLADGKQCTVFERNSEPGGVWADGYLNFGVQVQRELYEFPDWPLPREVADFTPGPVLQNYLMEYIQHFGLAPHIRLDSNVVGVAERSDGKPGWTVSYRESGTEYAADFDLVVICTGLYSNQANMPEFPGRQCFEGEVIHNSALKERAQLEGKRVVVLGYGKSATDATLEAAAVAAKTSIVFRTPHWPVPQHLSGIVPFKWGMFNRLTGMLIPPYQRRSGYVRAAHSAGKPMVWLFWRLVELLLFIQFRLGSRFGTRVSLTPSSPIETDCFTESTMVPRPELYRLIRRGTIDAYRTEIEGYTSTGIRLKSGVVLDVDVMILATGWRTDYGFLGEKVRSRLEIGEDGRYLYRHMVSPDVPNMVFLGCNTATFESILTYSLQARWLSELLNGRHQLPTLESMRAEIEMMKTWKRKTMPFSHSRGARLSLHQIHYHDELLSDFGANPRRKTGLFAPLKELFDPYEPNDYKDIVAGIGEKES